MYNSINNIPPNIIPTLEINPNIQVQPNIYIPPNEMINTNININNSTQFQVGAQQNFTGIITNPIHQNFPKFVNVLPENQTNNYISYSNDLYQENLRNEIYGNGQNPQITIQNNVGLNSSVENIQYLSNAGNMKNGLCSINRFSNIQGIQNPGMFTNSEIVYSQGILQNPTMVQNSVIVENPVMFRIENPAQNFNQNNFTPNSYYTEQSNQCQFIKKPLYIQAANKGIQLDLHKINRGNINQNNPTNVFCLKPNFI